jgi:hypothetical protein
MGMAPIEVCSCCGRRCVAKTHGRDGAPWCRECSASRDALEWTCRLGAFFASAPSAEPPAPPTRSLDSDVANGELRRMRHPGQGERSNGHDPDMSNARNLKNRQRFPNRAR